MSVRTVAVAALTHGCAIPTPPSDATIPPATTGTPSSTTVPPVPPCVPPSAGAGPVPSGSAADATQWGDGRIYLLAWPPATGVVEDDAIAVVSGWREGMLGGWLARLPDVDGDGCDELYAWAAGESLVRWFDGFVLPVEAVAAGDQTTDAFTVLRDTRIYGSVADVTGDGIADLVQPFSANEFPASVTVFDGATLGEPAGELRYDQGHARIDTEGSSSNYGWPSGGIDLDGLPGDDLYVGWQDLVDVGRGRVDVFANALLDGATVPTFEAAYAHLTGRRAGAPAVAAAGAIPDVTGDGVPELFSTQPSAAFGGVEESGEIAVIDGATVRAGGAFDYDDAIVRIGGTDPYDTLGMSAQGVPDLDGDGLGELLVGGSEPGEGTRALLFRGSDLGLGGVLRKGDAAVAEEGLSSPEVLPDLDDDGVPEIGAWGPDGFVAWSGTSLLLAAGGRFSDAPALGLPARFRDEPAWGNGSTGAGDDGRAVAFLRTPDGWLVALGAPGAITP